MRIISTTSQVLAAALVAFSAPVFAHHGDAGRFDENTITLTGTVVAVQLVNPHAAILFSVEDKSGTTTTWTAELGSPRQLSTRFGWTRTTLTPGTRITVTGRPLKSGSPYINLTERARIVLSDTCSEIYHSNTLPDEPMACAATGS
jgi:hypothetical protein